MGNNDPALAELCFAEDPNASIISSASSANSASQLVAREPGLTGETGKRVAGRVPSGQKIRSFRYHRTG